jgi:hypothetical protein
MSTPTILISAFCRNTSLCLAARSCSLVKTPTG